MGRFTFHLLGAIAEMERDLIVAALQANPAWRDSTNVALVPGQDAYVKIESLGSWSTFVGAGYVAARDTFYARLMLPQIARSEIVQSFFDGGS
jgi:hypothetical protein